VFMVGFLDLARKILHYSKPRLDIILKRLIVRRHLPGVRERNAYCAIACGIGGLRLRSRRRRELSQRLETRMVVGLAMADGY
jgi:hypothetical protein